MYWTDIIATLAVPDALWHPLAMAETRVDAQAIFDADIEAFHRCFKKKAMATHPDRGGTVEAFRKAHTAWEAIQEPAWLDAVWGANASMRLAVPNHVPSLFRAASARRFGFAFGEPEGMRNMRGSVFSAIRKGRS